jgi:hypothetical protein
MDYQAKLKYYENEYVDNGLPEGTNTIEFFSMDLIQGIKENFFIYFHIQDFVELMKLNNNEAIKTLCRYFIDSNFTLIGPIEILANDPIASENFIENVVYLINSENKGIRLKSILLIFNNEKLTEIFLENTITKSSNIPGIMFSSIKPELAIELLKREDYIDCFLSQDSSYFFSFINTYGQLIDAKQLVDKYMAKFTYDRQIDMLEKKYNPETGEPAYFQELYEKLKDVLKSKKIRNKIDSIINNPTEESVSELRELINSPEGNEVFLSEILEPTFSSIVELLGLDKTIYKTRKEKLLEKLSNYAEYEESVVKDIFCVYCFDDVYINTKLRLKTIIEYIQTKPEIAPEFKDQIPYIKRLYDFLNNEGLTESPLDIINYLDIKGIITRMHSIFSEETNKKTNVSDILSNSQRKIVNNVSVIDVDIPLDRSYFLVHSVSASDIGDNPLESYQESAKKHNRICTSILDNNHTNTFLNGIVFGYCNINAPLYSAIPCDGQTNQRAIKSGYPQFRSILTGVDRFLHRTTSTYNELTYETNNEIIMPSYILVVDREPNDLDYRVAQSFNIPILVYHTKKVEYEYEPVLLREEFDYSTQAINYLKKQQNKKMLT